jgi:hypothetical protein
MLLSTPARLYMCSYHRSERAKRTGATGAILKEASQINRSLMQLGLVVSRLAFLSEGNQNASSSSASSPSTGGSSGGGHIPYRNSKLTHLLADSLGGRALAVMVTCVSPSSFDQEETVHSESDIYVLFLTATHTPFRFSVLFLCLRTTKVTTYTNSTFIFYFLHPSLVPFFN